MKTKRIALLLAAMLLLSAMAACSSPSASDGGASAEPPPVETSDSGQTSWVPPSNVGTVDPIPAGALDFSDGNTGYLGINMSPGGADPAELSIIDYDGRSALKVELTADGNPYVGFDVSSMFGDKVADIRTIEMRIFTEHPDGQFYASSGKLVTQTGPDAKKETEYLWAVAVPKNNPRVLTAELTEFFVPNEKNIIVLSKQTDLGVPKSNMIVDYVLFLDGAGNPMTPDTSVSFNAPDGFGSSDFSMLFTVKDEVQIGYLNEGKTGKSSGWGQAGDVRGDDLADIKDLIVPGSIFTVYYNSEKVPEIIFQTWDTERPEHIGGWNKVAPYSSNTSGNIAQYLYEDCIEAFNDDDLEWLTCICIGGWGVDLDVSGFTIGMRVEDSLPYKPIKIGHDGFVDLTPMIDADGLTAEGFMPMKSVGTWKLNFRVLTSVNPEAEGPINPKWFVPGAFITAYYQSAEGCQFCVQRVRADGVDEIFAGADANSDDLGFYGPEYGIDQISYEALMKAWETKGGSAATFADEFNIFWVQNRNADMDLYKVILYTPTLNDSDPNYVDIGD